MKTKTILSSFILIAFAILGGGSIEPDTIAAMFWVFVIGFFVLMIVAVIYGNIENEKKKERQEAARLEREERLKNQASEYNAQKQQFLTANGTPDKSIILNDLDINSEIHVFESKKKVFILGEEYSFNDVISCTFSDSQRVIKGKISAVTKTKNGNVIKRAIVGDVLAGSAGAIIGGTTAEKHTEFIQGDDKTVHDYTVIINMNSISKPIIRIHTGTNGSLTNEIVGLMNVIISRK